MESRGEQSDSNAWNHGGRINGSKAMDCGGEAGRRFHSGIVGSGKWFHSVESWRGRRVILLCGIVGSRRGVPKHGIAGGEQASPLYGIMGVG